MSGENTTQVEGLDFTVQDHTSHETERMTRAMEHFHGAVEKTAEELNSLGRHTAMTALGAVGLGIGFHAIAEKAKEANMELEGAAKRIAGVQYTFGGWEKGITGQQRWNESLAIGREVVERLEVSEGRLKMSRSELADIYTSAVAIGERYGLDQEQQIDLTEKLGAAQKVLGVSAEAASMQLTRMAMTGKVVRFDNFSKSLRFALGDLKAFGKLNEEKRFEKLQKAMGDLTPAAEGMGKGMAGSLFDAREAIDNMTRDLTGPVFKEVAKDISTWAHKLTEVRESGKSIAHEYGEKLVSAFGYLKDATAFIADHWVAIAGIIGASKMTGMMESLSAWGKSKGGAGGAAGGIASAVGGMSITTPHVTINYASSAALGLGQTAGSAIGAQLRPSLASTVGGLASMAGKTLMVTEALGALYVGAESLAQWMLAQQDKALSAQRAAPRTMSALTSGAKAMSSALNERSVQETFSHLRSTFDSYGMKMGQHLSAATIASELRSMAPELAAKQIGMYGIKGASAKGVQGAGFIDEASGRIAALLNGFADQLLANYPELAKSGAKVARKADTLMHIDKVEIHPDFKDPNPDRVFHRMCNEILDIAHNPRGSMLTQVVR